VKNNPTDIIFWADEAILMVNKPAGLLSLPDGYKPDTPHLKSILEPEYGQLWIIHRLDRETSGVLVLGRTESAHKALNTQFEKREVIKIYHALVLGNPAWEEITIDLPLRPDGDRRHRTVVDHQRGKPSVSHLRLLDRFRGYALVEARPETGRTHQIRAHLSETDHPVAVDTLYGDGSTIYLSMIKPGYQPGRSPERPLLDRLGLHACSLTIQHPVTGETMTFDAPYPHDLTATLHQLRKSSQKQSP
jgi:RluA family pseudouridine synthase